MKSGSPGCTAHGLARMSSGILVREFSLLHFVLGTKSTRGRTRPLCRHPVAVLSCLVSLNLSVWYLVLEDLSLKFSLARLGPSVSLTPSDLPGAKLWFDLCFCKIVVCQLVVASRTGSLIATTLLIPHTCSLTWQLPLLETDLWLIKLHWLNFPFRDILSHQMLQLK